MINRKINTKCNKAERKLFGKEKKDHFKKPLSVTEQTVYLTKMKRIVYKDVKEDEAQDFLQTHNYINVISPFKYHFAKKDDHGIPVKKNGRHIYERDIDFEEYKEKYTDERAIYPKLYTAITYFETVFNSIVSNEILRYYNIIDEDSFYKFVYSLSSNISNSKSISNSRKLHMLNTVTHFKSELEKYNSPYIFMDRLSLSELSTIYLACDKNLSISIFNSLRDRNMTIGYTRKTDFDRILSVLIQVRNCVIHSNSLTVLIRYYDVKTKTLRNRTNRRRYEVLISNLNKTTD